MTETINRMDFQYKLFKIENSISCTPVLGCIYRLTF